MSLSIDQVKDIMERFNKIESSRDENLVMLDEDKVGDGSLGEHICHLYYHKTYDVYFIATSKVGKLYVEPAFSAYHVDPYLAQRRLEHLILNNVSITEFLESGEYKGFKDYILTNEVYNKYRAIQNIMYKFEGDLDYFYRTDKRLEKDTNPPKEAMEPTLHERVLKTMEINNSK